MFSERTRLAAHNNAVWCDTVSATHGTPGTFTDAAWFCEHATPPFYPNVVTLTPDDTDGQRQVVERLIGRVPDFWAVKDSFAVLDIHALGFMPVFEAQWIWRDADAPLPSDDAMLRWSPVADADDLQTWHVAWNGDQPSDDEIFLPRLLADPSVKILAARRDKRIVGGVIANRTGDVVGLSNLFVAHDAETNVWAGAVATIAGLFPGLPIVGYERDDDLRLAEANGFERCGALRIWAGDGS